MNQPSLDKNVSLQLQRLIPARRERVFRAWVEREALQQWFRPGGIEVKVSRWVSVLDRLASVVLVLNGGSHDRLE